MSTAEIVKKHMNDFNCENYTEKVPSYSKYLDSLGGVFSKYKDFTGTVTTVAGFHDISEYVFGLWSIYGFDYNNGDHNYKWEGGYPFYVNGKQGKCNWGRIDDLCGKTSKSKTTNCNFGIDSLLYKAGLFGKSGQMKDSCSMKTMVKSGCPVIHNLQSLQVGDLIELFRNPVTSKNPSTWSKWGHVVVVGEINNGSVIVYDTGSRFIRSKTMNYKYKFTVDGKNKPSGNYNSFSGWIGIRSVVLPDAVRQDRTLSDLAVSVLYGDYGSGPMRKKLLGSKYDSVQKMVTYLVNHPFDRLFAEAQFVLAGHAGLGDIRKEYLGERYDIIQEKINEILQVSNTLETNG